MGLKIGVDWNGDGIAAIGYTAGDFLNTLDNWYPDHTDYTTLDYSAAGASTVSIVPIITPYGQDALRFAIQATTDHGYIYKDGATYGVTTTNNRYYRILFWYRFVSETGGSFPAEITPFLYTNSNADLEISGSAFNKTGEWTRVEMTLLATSSDNLNLRLQATAVTGNTITYDITGLYIHERVNEPAAGVPLGYNSGDTLDAYDNLTEEAKEIEWSGGGDPYIGASGEKRAIVLLKNNHPASEGGPRYSPDNTTSPLYGYMLPNRHFLIWWDDEILYQGYTDTIEPTPFMAGDQEAVLEATNLVAILNKYKVLLEAYFSSTADVIIAAELAKYSQRVADYAYYNSKLDTGQTTFIYYGDNSQQSELTPAMPLSLWTIFSELAEAERGKVFVDKDGAVRFMNRYWNADPTIGLTLDNTAQDIVYTSAGVALINRVVVKAYPRVEGASGTAILWQLEKNMRVKPGRVRKFKTKYIDQATEKFCGGKEVVTPTGADYVTSGGSPVLTFTPGGEEAEVAIDNTAGSDDCLLTTFVVRGRKIKTLNPIEIYAEDEELIALYGLREIYLDLKALDNADDANDLAVWELAQRSHLTGLISAVSIMRESNGTDNLAQLTLGAGDTISLADAQLGIDGLYTIIGYDHTIIKRSRAHHTTFYLERALAQSFWILGTSELGTETILGY